MKENQMKNMIPHQLQKDENEEERIVGEEGGEGE